MDVAQGQTPRSPVTLFFQVSPGFERVPASAHALA